MARALLSLLGITLTAIAIFAAERPEMTPKRTDVKPFEYVDAKIPLYLPGAGRKGDAQANKMQKPLDAEESKKHFVTPKDFEVRTFVTEKMLGGKPLTMAWDEQGRLWVSISLDYPNEKKPDGEGRDRIVVCEDTDGDGVCDKVTTFADKLSIVTSILHFRGGIIVHSAPETLFLKDTDGDGKADLRQVLINGWGTRDTHSGPNNLRYGFDNWVYGMVGYSGFTGEVNGEKLTFKQGMYRFKIEASPGRKSGESSLRVSKLEFLRSTSNNSWGLGFSEDGQLFGSTANGCGLVHMPIPNRYYEKVRGLSAPVLPSILADNHIEPITDKVRQVDWHGGFTAAAGSSLYTARTYPKEYWNRVAFVCEPTGHLAAALVIEPNGTTYKARYGWNLLASDDEWSAPIQAEVGPDGHVWVIDWYNFIVQHNPTPVGFTTGKGAAYETPLRDKTHGRIYRVVYMKAKPEPRVNLKGATPEKLVETLKHHNMTWRLHAQRLLVERGKDDGVSGLLNLIADTTSDESGLNVGSVHAIKALSDLRPILKQTKISDIDQVLRSATVHPSPAVRCAALAALPNNLISHVCIPGRFENRFEQNSFVRLSAFLAAADLKADGTAWPLEVRIMAEIVEAKHIDRQMREAMIIAAASRAGSALVAASNVDKPITIEGADALETVSRIYASGGGDKMVPDILANMAVGDTNPKIVEVIITGFASTWPTKLAPTLTTEGEAAIGKLLSIASSATRGRLLRLASIWGVKGLDAQLADLTKKLFVIVADAKADEAARLDAARQVIDFRPDDEATAAKLLDAITGQASPTFVSGIFEVLGTSKAKSIGTALLAKLKDIPPTARPTAMRLVLARTESATAFLDAVEAGQARFDMLNLEQKAALASHPNKKLAERAKKLLALGGGLPNADRQKVIEEFAFVTKQTGSAEAGKKVFTQHCAKCHKFGGEGTPLGPDLTGMAVHPKEELLVHILDPSRSVEGNYKAYRATTADGRVIVGLLASESKTTVELVDAEGKKHPLQRDNIEALVETDKSLMPDGFEKQAKPEEFIDLLEFLTQKGKVVPPMDTKTKRPKQ